MTSELDRLLVKELDMGEINVSHCKPSMLFRVGNTMTLTPALSIDQILRSYSQYVCMQQRLLCYVLTSECFLLERIILLSMFNVPWNAFNGVDVSNQTYTSVDK